MAKTTLVSSVRGVLELALLFSDCKSSKIGFRRALSNNILEASFAEYMQQHTEAFRYSPTPDCGFFYQCSDESDPGLRAYRCSNCFELVCTHCHARHGDYTCSEYRDIVSGGYEALEQLKKELDIRDCPKCKTPMEKMEGCNHMTCGDARHIFAGCVWRLSTPAANAILT